LPVITACGQTKTQGLFSVMTQNNTSNRMSNTC
jgi:hypothetical protein